jgi:putative hydrolase of the HAD superfamily
VPTSVTIFDLDDTLIVEEEVARNSMRQVGRLLPDESPERVEEVILGCARQLWRTGPHRQLCGELGIASWEGLWATFEGGHPRLDGLRDWARGYRPEVWRLVVETFGADDPELPAAMSDTFVAGQRRGHTLIDGAGPAVHTLSQSRRLGLLTNGPADIPRFKFDGTGLAECFDAVVISGEVGIGKPDPAVFAYALDRLGTTAEETVMVGDSWERDVLGALGAGMSAVWVAGGRPRPEELGRYPDVKVVDTVGELTGLVDW